MDGRATFFFTAGNYGWSETFFRVSADRADLLKAAAATVVSRSQCLGEGANLVYLRVSDDSVFRDVEIKSYLDVGLKHFGGGGQTDEPWTGVLVRMQSGDQSWRNMIVRGVPDDAVINPFDLSVSPGFKDALQTWFASLKANAFGNKSLVQGGANAPVAILAMAANVGGGIDVTVGAGFVIAAGQQVHIRNQKAVSGALQGTYNVFSTDPANNKFNIRAGTGPAMPVGLISLGTVQGKTKSIAPFSAFTVMRTASRRTGRPFGLPLGRRRRSVKK